MSDDFLPGRTFPRGRQLTVFAMLMSCFTATMTARALRSTPIYTQILIRTLKAAGNHEGLALIRNLARR